MSAYEDARLVIQQAMFGVQSGTWLSHKVSKDVLDAVLLALPSSIVVDGQVVELWKVVSYMMRRHHRFDQTVEDFLDAAREVAECERSEA